MLGTMLGIVGEKEQSLPLGALTHWERQACTQAILILARML